jgi:2-polyprenyl-6-methoxyphenol hydroxylase-like FAD-dependent oxidoreductase
LIARRRSAAAIFDALCGTGPAGAPRVRFDRAVVLGGSVAGLLAARVLADHAREVVVFEPDRAAAPDGSRSGAPHSNQLHVLQPGGRSQLDRWFPGFAAQAAAEGAVLVDPSARTRYRNGRRRVAGAPVESLSLTRPFLEDLLRRRTSALPNVTFAGHRAAGLEVTGAAVTGVRCAGPDAETVEPADFVVDAMGRSSRLGDWLERAGWEAAPVRRMPIRINYATALFRRAEPDPPTKTALALRGALDGSEAAGAAFAAVEGDRWMALLAGFVDHRPGRTADDFVRRCREEYPPEFGHVVSGEMLGPVANFHLAESRRRDYHAVRRLPAGVASVGDAVASFNPIYAQGLSSAALHAACLSAYLRSDDVRAPARGFFARQRIVVDAAWGFSTRADLALPHIDGPYPRGYRATRWISRRIVDAAQVDPVVARRFDEVTFMQRHPSTLVTPEILARSFRSARRATG